MKALVRGNSANLVLLLEGWSADQAAICDAAMETTAASKDPRILLRRSSIKIVLQLLTASYRACWASARSAQETAQAIGDIYMYAMYTMLEAVACLHLGEWRELQRSATAALAMSQRNANRQAAVLCELSIAWLQAEALDFAGARARAEAALDPAIDSNPFNFFLGRNLLAKAALGLRDYNEAEAQFAKIRHKIEDEGVPMDTSLYPQFYFNQSKCWLELGDLARAKEMALQLKAFAAPQMEITYLALSHCLLGEIARVEGDVETASAEFAQGVNIVEAGEAPLAAWRLYLAAAELHDSIAEPDEAAALRRNCGRVIDSLANMFDEGDPLRSSFLDGYEAEGRRCLLNPAARIFGSVRSADSHSARGGSGSKPHRP